MSYELYWFLVARCSFLVSELSALSCIDLLGFWLLVAGCLSAMSYELSAMIYVITGFSFKVTLLHKLERNLLSALLRAHFRCIDDDFWT